MKEKIKSTVTTLVDNVQLHWSTPLKGYYMPFKEVVGYSIGGIGVKCISWMALQIILSTSNVIIGNTLGVGQTDMYILYVISVLANIPLTAIRANIVDNTRNRQGKYRPYIIKLGIPAAIVNILFVWFPYREFGNLFGDGTFFGKAKWYVVMCAVILLLNIIQNFCYNFFYEAYENLIHVLSPNTQERTNVASIKAVVYSLAPSIINIIIPMVAQRVANNNIYDITVYRYVYPPLTIVSFFFLVWVYSSTKEKIVRARSHFIQIKFVDAFREVMHNKYFWIISLAGWIGFLEAAFSNILSYLFNYGGYCNGDQYALIQTIYGNASLWGMLATPLAVRKWGKKKVLIFTNTLNILFIALMIPILDMAPAGAVIWLVLSVLYLNALVGAIFNTLSPAIQADIRDYQQYVSGERIDGMFAAVGTIGSIITLFTSGVLPLINERYGINMESATEVVNRLKDSGVMRQSGDTIGQAIRQALDSSGGEVTAYFSLYDPDILHNLLVVLILFSVFGAAMNVLPYFWYDLTEAKQRAIVAVLKIRALFEDFGNGVLNDRDLVEAVEIIDSAHKHYNVPVKHISKTGIKQARITHDKDAIKAAKKAYRDDQEFNKQIEIASFVMNELHKFEKPYGIKMLEESSIIYTRGVEALKNENVAQLKEQLRKAKAMPKGTYEEKETRKEVLRFYRNRITAAKYMKKYFGDKPVQVPDRTKLTELFNAEDMNEEDMNKAYKRLYDAQKAHDKDEVAKIRVEIKELKKKEKELAAAEKVEANSQTYFNRACKPYIDAEKLVKQAENYKHFDEIKSRYEEAKVRVEEEERLAQEKVLAEKRQEIKKTPKSAPRKKLLKKKRKTRKTKNKH